MLSLIVLVSTYLLQFISAEKNATLDSFNYNQALTSVWLSGAAYCGTTNYKSHVFKGPTAGFVVTAFIEDVPTDTEGYIGYLPSDKSIYVVFRGSSSIRNWISNLDIVKTSYKSFPECNCQVHKGFYDAEQKVFSGILTEVKRLQSVQKGYAVKTTGHSLGAALALLTAMDLVKNGIATTITNFGQPRAGDASFASFTSNKLPVVRVTHNKDMVPHIPYMEMGFYHECTEAFEDVNGNVKDCVNTCEDTACANQYKFSETTVDDHYTYLGVGVNCDAVSSV